MTQGYFITATDTDAGKTYIACKLLLALQNAGFHTAGLKPIASGCKATAQGLRNEDALQLQQAATLHFPYHQVNPVALEPAIAPHLAGKQIGQTLSIEYLLQACQPILTSQADYIVVEGAGGWLVPLNEKETLADFALRLKFPIILVVGMKLGCINHSLLTWQQMQNQAANVMGWIANCIDPAMQALNENIITLKNLLPIPLLSIVKPNQKTIQLKEFIIF